MKKIILTLIATFIILFTQAQCQADFSYMQNGSSTIFADLSTVSSSWSTNCSVTWEWDFGDGTPISIQQNPVHTYLNNGIYTPCLTVVYFDSVIINTCVSVYCDSIVIGNSIPSSWDCSPSGCYDPGTGLGQYLTFSACDTSCGIPTPSWDCPVNMPGGCYDPGNGLGQYSSLAACQAVCGTPSPSWNCGPLGCYDPGTGMGQYTTQSACQTACIVGSSILCDSMLLFSTGGSLQTILMAEVPNINTIIDYWITTAPDGTVLGEDSMWNSHQIFNMNPVTGQPFDTINVCITYADPIGYYTCCITWVWNGSFWAKMGSVTAIGEIGLFDKKLIKVVDVLGRETAINNSQTLFFIYEDGTIERRYIVK